MPSHSLDLVRRNWANDPFAALRRLADGGARVRGNALPLERPLEDALQDGQDLANGRIPKARPGEVGTEAGDDLGIEVAEPDRAQTG
jgi:hypothetical protein